MRSEPSAMPLSPIYRQWAKPRLVYFDKRNGEPSFESLEPAVKEQRRAGVSSSLKSNVWDLANLNLAVAWFAHRLYASLLLILIAGPLAALIVVREWDISFDSNWNVVGLTIGCLLAILSILYRW